MKMPVDGLTGCLGSFMQLKDHYKYLKLILSIGGAGASQNFAQVASSAIARDNFARSVRVLVDASGFDGIDSMFFFSVTYTKTLNELHS